MTKRYLSKFTGASGTTANGYATALSPGTASTTDGSSMPTPAQPLLIAPGDLALCAFYSREATDGVVAVEDEYDADSNPGGWRTLYNHRDTGGLMAVFWRWHKSGDGPPTFTSTGIAAGDTCIAQVGGLRGVRRRQPFGSLGAVSTNASAANIGAISGVTLAPKGLVVVVGGKADDWTSVATLTQTDMTFVELGEPDSTSGNDAGMVWQVGSEDNGAEVAVSDKTFAVTGGGSAVGKGLMFTVLPELVYEFPLNRYEWEPSQGLRSPAALVSGADYAVRHLRQAPGLMEVAEERVRMVYTGTESAQDDEADELRAALHEIGLGKLWTKGADDSERWAWAELAEMPLITARYGQNLIMPMVLSFRRLSPWFDDTLTTSTEAVSASGHRWEVENPGNAPVKAVVVQLQASGAAGIVNPKVTNLTNGYELETSRDSGATTDVIRFDTGRGKLEYSDDDGATWADDLANLILPTTNAPLAFVLEPGVNTLEYTGGGTPSLSVLVQFYGAWK